ncbi:hypothetical protein SDRG_07007 [Saprolegnia diclina VS20]|uniref:Uncharacterized protein n=1 Tax=Saprolegnia diclina (strain VS20) TaxID=1156394 RepID=T0QCV1_SAPDV|nr:hypothetical protein SDRG_07007 [Saprolegnia diclina VS20]EQC35729.1 hypothetical protein SDRG_07007 [Saprolegnia diclina VS20]|eukprot:XP_008611046.1 hypothetical protein SDRG_07007 [Saprolegnia diclina VS20]
MTFSMFPSWWRFNRQSSSKTSTVSQVLISSRTVATSDDEYDDEEFCYGMTKMRRSDSISSETTFIESELASLDAWDFDPDDEPMPLLDAKATRRPPSPIITKPIQGSGVWAFHEDEDDIVPPRSPLMARRPNVYYPPTSPIQKQL